MSARFSIRRLRRILAATVTLGWCTVNVTAAATVNVNRDGQTPVVLHYLNALRDARYSDAYGLLNSAARGYYREPANFASIFVADSYRVTAFTLTGTRGDNRAGRVYFVRETARYRDHAHDVDLIVHATVPIGVVADGGTWRIKDPGHPWRAFATNASAQAGGVRVAVKKISFFTRRIEAVVSFTNTGSHFVTILAYGKSILHDAAARPYRIIETRDWSLTDKTLFEGLHLAANARYTGTLSFACEPVCDNARAFALSVGPLLGDGDDAPFSIDVVGINPIAALK